MATAPPQRAEMSRSSAKIVLDALRCPICWDTAQQPAHTECGHTFCTRCIKVALQAKKECPVCREPVASHRKLRLELVEPSAPMLSLESSDANSWSCPRCTMLNTDAAARCAACHCHGLLCIRHSCRSHHSVTGSCQPALQRAAAVCASPIGCERRCHSRRRP